MDGAYSSWSAWGACDQSCGSGHKLRVRSCSSPEPQFGGKNCSSHGPEYELVACNTDPCPGKLRERERKAGPEQSEARKEKERLVKAITGDYEVKSGKPKRVQARQR